MGTLVHSVWEFLEPHREVAPLESPGQRALADRAVSAEEDLDPVEGHLDLILGLEEESPVDHPSGGSVVGTIARGLPILWKI